jgi:hypothetical protein
MARIEKPEKASTQVNQADFWQRGESNLLEESSLFNKLYWNNWVFLPGYPLGKKLNLNRNITVYVNITQSGLGLNVKHKIRKPLEENLNDLWLGKEFLNMIQKNTIKCETLSSNTSPTQNQKTQSTKEKYCWSRSPKLKPFVL